MKRSTAISAVTVIAALSLTGQAFAFGGGMGGGQMGGSMGGGHQMSSGMHATNGTGMQGPMHDTGPQHTAMNGTGPQSLMQGGTGTAANSQHGQMNGSGSGMTTTHTPATTTTK